MKLSKFVAAAGLTLSLGAFTPVAFAQVGGTGSSGTTSGGGMPGAAGLGQNVTGSSPSSGQPGTQAPASGAPIGTASSDYMSSEGHQAAANSGPASALPGKSATQSEKQLRAREVALERDIMATRAQGINVSQATHEKWLGSMALKKGDKIDAMQHFDRAAKHLALARAGDSSASQSRTSLHANETNQPDGATNMHSNRSSTSVY